MKAIQSTYPRALTALVLASACQLAAAAGSLVLTPVNSSVMSGNSFNVEVRGTGFTDSVVGGGFNLDFNPAVLSLTSVTINTLEWEFLTNPGTINNAAGTLRDVWFNAFAAPLPTGNFPVAVLSFAAKLPGNSPLSLLAATDFPFANDLAQVISVSFGSGAVSVSAVPELSSWMAMVLGLALMPMLRRRVSPAA
jgi:hypothetical protein